MAAANRHSLRWSLVLRLVGPVLLLTLLAGVSAYAIARHFASNVLDQWLHDSAISLANRVNWSDRGASVDLPEGARQMLEWDLVDRVFYEVLSAKGERIAGNVYLPAPPRALTRTNDEIFYDGLVHGTRVRVLALVLSPGDDRAVVVKVAETQQKRSSLAWQLLLISVAVSLLFALISAGLIWAGIGRGITSMEGAVRDLRVRDASARLVPIAVPDTTPVELIPLVEQINRLIDELTASHRVTERFVVNAAHQLRTPVATLRVTLETARRERDPQRRSEAIDDAVKVVANMGRVLHQLLTLARTDERGTHPGTEARADIDSIAREEVERRVDDALSLDVDLGYEGPSAPVVVAADSGLVREALANLLDNALVHGATGGHVTVGVVDGDTPELYVEDRGPGIAPAERDRIGDRFYRVPGTSGPGSGLGLSIVSEIARLYRGRLVLESGAQGVGLRARLVLARVAGTFNATMSEGDEIERPVSDGTATETLHASRSG